MENKFDLKTLYPKLVSGQLTGEELNWLLDYFNTGNREDLNQLVRSELTLSDEELVPTADEAQTLLKVYDHVQQELGSRQAQKTPVRMLWPRIAAAAAVLLVALTTVLYFYPGLIVNHKYTSMHPDDIPPGKITATLTLADGRKIILSDTLSGEPVKEAGVLITQSADGQLVYEMIGHAGTPDVTKMNTLSTAKGETYQVRLPDGSLVALNAASSITYAASLNIHGERRVKLKGEAYFEVANDEAHPFIVQTDKQIVEVMGTHFNVKAYADEPVTRTTLLEGSVKVAGGGRGKTLKPGEQATMLGDQIQVKEVETEDVISWKNGYFMFNSERLESIMVKIARWYDVEAEFEDPSLKNETFFGSISRFENVSKVLKLLEATDVATFKINGNKIYIRKKR